MGKESSIEISSPRIFSSQRAERRKSWTSESLACYRRASRSISPYSDPALAAGTLPYMAPEQLRGEPADVRTDIYASGVVLYEMVTGQRPFREQTPLHLMDAICTALPRRSTSRGPTCPPRSSSSFRNASNASPNGAVNPHWNLGHG